MPRAEDEIQREVVKHMLDIERVHDAFWFCAIPNAAKRKPRFAAYLKGIGLRPGAPDLHFIWNGRAHYIELKAPSKKGAEDSREKLQKAVHTQITLAGGAVVTLDSFDAVRGFLDCVGVPRLDQRRAA